MRQAEAFLAGEGDAWYERNRFKPRLRDDPVLTVIEECELKPEAVLEVGCGDGWRLAVLREAQPTAWCCGVDASKIAVERARTKGLSVHQSNFMTGTWTRMFDLIIFGFCLYVVDREDLFRWVQLTDNLLNEGGHIIIHDFVPEYPYRRAYAHKEGLWSYKMDHSKLWLAHPGYKEVRTDLYGEDDDRVGVTVIQKDFANAFPVREI